MQKYRRMPSMQLVSSPTLIHRERRTISLTTTAQTECLQPRQTAHPNTQPPPFCKAQKGGGDMLRDMLLPYVFSSNVGDFDVSELKGSQTQALTNKTTSFLYAQRARSVRSVWGAGER